MTISPPAHLSASSIGTFNQCPLKFKFNKIDGITDDPTEATLMGNFVHDVVEEFYKHDPEARSILLAKNLASQLWDEKWRVQVEPWVRGQDSLRMFRWNSWWCIENLWKIENPKIISPSGLEHEVNGEVGGVKIKGFIDRFSIGENGLVISDYKTGKVPKPRYAGDKFFQLHLYAHLLKSEGLGQATKVELLYLKEGKTLSSNVKDEDLQLAEKIVVDTKNEIDKCCETGEFEARQSILCNWCSYKSICPIWNK